MTELFEYLRSIGVGWCEVTVNRIVIRFTLPPYQVLEPPSDCGQDDIEKSYPKVDFSKLKSVK